MLIPEILPSAQPLGRADRGVPEEPNSFGGRQTENNFGPSWIDNEQRRSFNLEKRNIQERGRV